MAPTVDAGEFGRIWEAAWNCRDAETVLTHSMKTRSLPHRSRNGSALRGMGLFEARMRYAAIGFAALEKNPALRFRVTGRASRRQGDCDRLSKSGGRRPSRSPQIRQWPCRRRPWRFHRQLNGMGLAGPTKIYAPIYFQIQNSMLYNSPSSDSNLMSNRASGWNMRKKCADQNRNNERDGLAILLRLSPVTH